MIGADELTLTNNHGCVIVVRRGRNARQQIEEIEAEINRLGVSMDLPADDIRARIFPLSSLMA